MIYNQNLLSDIRVNDEIISRGDRAIAGIHGTVTKVNRVTLELVADYMGNPMQLKIRRDDLRGEVRLARNKQIYTNQQEAS